MNDEKISKSSSDILVVDDVAENLKLLLNLLTPAGYKVRPASNGAEALDAVKRKKPDLILLDIKMPGMDGFEVCKRLKADSESENIPIIFISGLSETDDKLKAFEAGGVDYITKPFQEEEVLMRVQTHIELQQMRVNLESIVTERLKELTCIYSISNSVRRRETLEQIFQDTVDAIPPGWHYPEITRGKLNFNNKEFVTEPFEETIWKQSSDIIIDGQKVGEVQVYYLEEKPVLDEGPFLKEERNLINSIAQTLAEAILRKEGEKTLLKEVEFKQLVSKISSRFIGLSGDEFEDAIQNSLSEIGVYFKADAVRLFSLSLQGEILKHRFIWQSKQLEPSGELAKISSMIYSNFVTHFSSGKSLVFNKFSDIPQWPEMHEVLNYSGVKAGVGVPLESDKSGVDVFTMGNVNPEHPWPNDIVEKSKTIGQALLNAIFRREAETEIQKGYSEIKQLKEQLLQENIYLKEEIKVINNFDTIIGQSKALKYVLFRVEQVAPTDTTVLISGETGTGKEIFTNALHQLSLRKNKSMVKVNCAALSPTLIESELFGHEKGAFTGANEKRIGRFELADGGTIFLDEIGELSLEIQAKLLRVLQEGEFERLGSSKTIKVNVRIIAATNRNLEEEVKKNNFRVDLYYRLTTFIITIPPLRDRKDDIPLLVNFLINKLGKRFNKSIKKVPQTLMRKLVNYSWPGNVRELENVIENGFIISNGEVLKAEVPGNFGPAALEKSKLEDLEREHIIKVLEAVNWQIGGKDGAAERLGLKRTTLNSKMKKLNIKKTSR